MLHITINHALAKKSSRTVKEMQKMKKRNPCNLKKKGDCLVPHTGCCPHPAPRATKTRRRSPQPRDEPTKNEPRLEAAGHTHMLQIQQQVQTQQQIQKKYENKYKELRQISTGGDAATAVSRALRTATPT